MPSDFIERQTNDLIRDASALGSLFSYALAALIFLVLSDFSSFKMLVVGGILIYAAAWIIRAIFFKNRPVKLSYSNPFEKLDAAAFPSLHASRTGFLLLFFINYFANSALTVILILLALSILFSRVYLKKHDWKDVIAGAVLGVLAYFLVKNL